MVLRADLREWRLLETPDIVIHNNQVLLRNWTHATGGITGYDFALAEKIEDLIGTDASSFRREVCNLRRLVQRQRFLSSQASA